MGELDRKQKEKDDGTEQLSQLKKSRAGKVQRRILISHEG